MKRVLFVSYYFPPAGGPGVQRALKFVRYLPDFGWQPIVISVDPRSAAWPDSDEGMLGEIPDTVDVIRTKSWDPYAAYARMTGRSKEDSVGVGFADQRPPDVRERLARWIRANVFLPDARVGWLPHAWRAARAVLRTNEIDAVLTSGPPHSTHFIGKWARRKGVPWIADFRDPWTDLSYYDALPFTPPARWIDRRMEAGVLRSADDVITVSPAVAALLAPRAARPVGVITNGYDGRDFEDAVPESRTAFDLVHVGTLTAQQNAPAIWEACREITKERPDFSLRLVGRVDQGVIEAVRHGIAVERLAYVPHDLAIRHMKGAGALLLVVPRTARAEGILTGKLFEYLASGRPIVVVGPLDSDIGPILERTGAGVLCDWDDRTGIKEAISRAASAWDSGSQEGQIGDPAAIQTYDRRELARQLAVRLDKLVNQETRT